MPRYRNDLDPAKVTFKNIAGRREILHNHHMFMGWTHDEDEIALRQRAIEDLCKKSHVAGRIKVGHVYFEYMVDYIVWHENTKSLFFYNRIDRTYANKCLVHCRKAMGMILIEWPWSGKPKADDESLGISASYHEWRKRNGHEVPEDVTPLSAYEPASQYVFMSMSDLPPAKCPKLKGMADNRAEAIAKSQASDKAYAEQMAQHLALKRKMENDENSVHALATKDRMNAATAIFDEEVASINSGGAKKRKRPMSLTEESEAPILPDPVTLPVRSVPRVNIDKRALKIEVPTLHLRQQLWRSIVGKKVYQYPCVGPFEVTVPTWLNFDGLIWGENGEHYAGLLTTLHSFLTVGWNIRRERPVSLVVGFKPDREEVSNVHRHWQDLTMLWDDVVYWVVEVTAGTCTTLLESLTLSQWRRIFNIRKPSLPSPAKNQLASRAKLNTTEAEALKHCNEEETLTPQLYAILNRNPASTIEDAMWTWVYREDFERSRRAPIATKVWVVVATQNGSSDQAFQALDWEHRVMSCLNMSVDTAASE